jgi:Kef-type K+ transport system membrane component KefB
MVESTLRLITPLRDFFLPLFFATIGLYIAPSFHPPVILLTTLIVLIIKFICSFSLSRYWSLSSTSAGAIGVGLAHVSEFGFVLASRAQGSHLITRDQYYILLATIVCSLICAPLVWNLVCHVNRQQSILN